MAGCWESHGKNAKKNGQLWKQEHYGPQKHNKPPKKLEKNAHENGVWSHGFIWFNIFQPQKMGVESANSLIKFIYPSKHALSDQHVRTLDSFSVLSRHWGTWSILVW